MSNPTKDSNGHLVWKPQVGVYAKGAERQRESYGGIVGAFQDLAAEEGVLSKAYPHNFAGIIAAIQDLAIGTQGPPVSPGPNPGGGTIDSHGDWIELVPPRAGDLWFDTRQGRLFVYVNDEWVQTNGADGLAQITQTSTPPTVETTPAPGQFWWDANDQDLYIFDGLYEDASGNVSSNPSDTPVWRLIVDSGADNALQTTRTLPLANIGPRIEAYVDSDSLLPEIDIEQFMVQQDYNLWLFEALTAIDTELADFSPVVISEDLPVEPKEGQLWYDTERLDMSIWYVDAGGDGQWVPISTPYTYDSDLDVIRSSIATETRQREVQINGLYTALSNLDIASNTTVQSLQQKLSALQTHVIQVADGHYATSSSITAELAELENKINAIVIPPAPDLTPYATKTSVVTLSNQVDTLPTQSDLNDVANSIPDVAPFVRQYDIDQAIAAITTDYLPRNGGVVNGSFIVNKTDYSSPALDFSGSPASSNQAFKFQTLGSTGSNYSTYGTTNNLWEQAWQFASDEDFCWIYNDTNKVFSITKEGPACSQLYIGDFGTNGNNGRVIHNKIDVKDRLTAYQSAFEQMRQAVSSSTDYDSLKAGLLTALANV